MGLINKGLEYIKGVRANRITAQQSKLYQSFGNSSNHAVAKDILNKPTSNTVRGTESTGMMYPNNGEAGSAVSSMNLKDVNKMMKTDYIGPDTIAGISLKRGALTPGTLIPGGKKINLNYGEGGKHSGTGRQYKSEFDAAAEKAIIEGKAIQSGGSGQSEGSSEWWNKHKNKVMIGGAVGGALLLGNAISGGNDRRY